MRVWRLKLERDYSGSVRRLVRDGVDTPLASLFVHGLGQRQTLSHRHTAPRGVLF